jgi:hypothetical protein
VLVVWRLDRLGRREADTHVPAAVIESAQSLDGVKRPTIPIPRTGASGLSLDRWGRLKRVLQPSR